MKQPNERVEWQEALNQGCEPTTAVITHSANSPEPRPSTYRGFIIIRVTPNTYNTAGASHGSMWSARCYIDELLSP